MPLRKTALIVLVIGVLSAPAVAKDVCDYKTQDWSYMREFLVEFSKQEKNKDVAKAARLALRGAKTHAIGEFEIVYGRGKTGEPPPNDKMCYPKAVNFRYLADESSYSCKSTWREDETLATLKCKLIAG